MKAHSIPGFLPAMAVASIAWFLYFNLAPDTPLTETKVIGVSMGPAGFLLMIIPLAFIWQGLFCQNVRSPMQVLMVTTALCCGLMLLISCIYLARQHLYAHAPPEGTLAIQLTGILLGLLTWWLTGQRLLNSMQSLSSWLQNHQFIMRLSLASGALLLLLAPLDTDIRMADVTTRWDGSSFSASFAATQQHLYTALKSIILWIPVGLVYQFAGKQTTLKIWVTAGIAGYALEASPWFTLLKVHDVLEVAIAPLGIWAGFWLGNHTKIPLMAHTAGPTAVIAGDTGASTAPSGKTSSPPLINWLSPHTGAGWLSRTAALLLLILAAYMVWDFPLWKLWLGAGLVVYLLVLWKYPPAWLLLVPALLPALNLAPSTGRFFFDEFDLLMICTMAMALWHGTNRERTATLEPAVIVALALFSASYFISLLIGLLPLQAIDANAFSSYWSSYNSIRIAKGGFWSLAIIVLLRWFTPWPTLFTRQLLTSGMLLGLVSVILIGLRERWQFAGLFNLAADYRVTASFSSMHTGGSHIEAYLVMATPFLWLLVMRNRRVSIRLSGLLVFLSAVYLMTTTIARGGVFALVMSLVVLSMGSYRSYRVDSGSNTRSIFLPIVLLLGASSVVIVGLSGEYFEHRLSRTEQDMQTRLDHWSNALSMMSDDWTTRVFGMGLGSFPVTYLYHGPIKSLPATYSYATEAGNQFLRLGAGGTLYMAQRIAVHNLRSYTLSMDLRSQDPKARLQAPMCEKHLLNSFRCQWQEVPFPAGNNQWHHIEVRIDSGDVGGGNWLSRRPVELSLYNPAAQTIVDIDNVGLTDSKGTDLIRNGDFSAGGDHWFFKTHEHLPWHIKNLWVQVLFEQGWLGLLAFCLLLVLLFKRLFTAMWSGDMFATTLLASITGFLVVGLVGSPFDAPRLATLFFTLLLLGAFKEDAGQRKTTQKPLQPGDA